jgi:alanine dehydrogenase
MVLVVRPEDHAGLVGLPEAIEAIEQGYRAWAEDARVNLLRQIVSERPRLAVHQASVPFLGRAGLMAHTGDMPGGEHGYHAASLVFDLETGGLDAIVLDRIDCGPPVAGVADLRTAATSAVGTRHPARSDATTVGVLGSGRQAQTQLAALAAVRPLRAFKVYSPTEAHRREYAARMASALDLEALAVDTARAAVEGVDIVLVATNTKEPVLLGDWLVPGQHVTSIMGGNTARDPSGRPVGTPRRDLDDGVLERSATIVINSRAQAELDYQGDIMPPIERGVLRWERVHELGELVAGRAPGRTRADQITLYKNNGGQGVADMALAALVARRARELGRGVEL